MVMDIKKINIRFPEAVKIQLLFNNTINTFEVEIYQSDVIKQHMLLLKLILVLKWKQHS